MPSPWKTAAAATLPVLLLLVALAGGCGGDENTVPHPVSPGGGEADSALLLREETARWLGTPHCMGGTDTRCVDCSGFVQAVVGRVYGVRLPRTTGQQVRQGRAVSADRLAPGDLVFFRPEGKGRHVGVYLSGGEFAHCSKSRGVMISRLDEPYWRQFYWCARRVLGR